jgi:RsiW-degrading membrane proteinase PrsW (M82 family)
MSTSTPATARKVVKIILWLWGLLPVGLWLLWKDEELSTTAKWRTLFYGFMIPLLVYLAFMATKTNHLLANLGV